MPGSTPLPPRCPAQAWRKIVGRRAGAKGPRLYHWARAAIRPLEDTDSYWLLVRRSLTDPDDLAYYLCHGPERTPLRELVRVAGARWAIEETFQTAKGQVGLDQYQVRRYDSLVPTHHAGHARPRLPHRHHRRGRRKRGVPPRSRS